MDDIVFSFFSPSKATIRDFVSNQFVVVVKSRTTNPIGRGDLGVALEKMREVAQLERECCSDNDCYLRLRCVEIDDKKTYSAGLHIDLVVAESVPANRRRELERRVQEAAAIVSNWPRPRVAVSTRSCRSNNPTSRVTTIVPTERSTTPLTSKG